MPHFCIEYFSGKTSVSGVGLWVLENPESTKYPPRICDCKEQEATEDVTLPKEALADR